MGEWSWGWGGEYGILVTGVSQRMALVAAYTLSVPEYA